MRHSKEYVLQYIDFLQHLPIKRVLLPDTLGVLIPTEAYAFIRELVDRYPQLFGVRELRQPPGLSVFLSFFNS